MLTEAQFTTVTQLLSAEAFEAQKHKHFSRQARGGAIGIIRSPQGGIVLVRRSGMHAGWALPGGTVERGEEFADAFIREIREEIGISLCQVHLIEMENKTFVSPSNEKFAFPLAVFAARTEECTLPAPTAAALAEGLRAQSFPADDLPDTMIFGDRGKIEAFLSRGAR